jgi:hypothetical protein
LLSAKAGPLHWPLSDPLSRSGQHAPIPEALTDLSRWDNIDKHRVIHATLLSGAVNLIRNPRRPPEFELIYRSNTFDQLEDGAEIGRWRFVTPLPFAWEPSEAYMKRHFPLEVSLNQPFPPKAILQVLPVCLWGVDQVLSLFDPVFTEGKPPLPVTAMPPGLPPSGVRSART